MNHGRFTDCSFLRAIGRNLLQEFFEKFEGELAAKKLVLPPIAATDDEFFTALSGMLLSPEGLPDRVNEVLHEVHELSTEEGHAGLKAAIAQNGLQLSLGDHATREEIALRVWLNSPALLAQKYNEQKFHRLTAFVYCDNDPECLPFGTSVENGRGSMERLVAQLDSWCAKNDRGAETVVIERFDLRGEEWYLIRHGDTYQRSAKVDKRKLEVMHYRPAKDDLVVYSPQTDRLRINAKTQGEQDLYRIAFGEYLHENPNYFRRTNCYTLDPLRDGAEALECHDIPGLQKVVLTQLEWEFNDGKGLSKTLKAPDLFACAAGQGAKELLLPKDATIKEATFRVHILNSSKPLEIRIKPPNTIRLGKRGPLPCVDQWIEARGFKPGKTKRVGKR